MENNPGNPPQPPAPGNPPQPPAPGNPPQPAGQPTYPSAPQVVYLQPGQQVVYLQPQPGQQTPMPAPGYNQGQWVYQQPSAQAPVLAPSSGWRIAAGILGIVLGSWNIIMFFGIMFDTYGPSTPLVGFLIFFHLVGALAALTLGIMVIVKHRRRSKPIPVMLLAASGWLVIVDMILADVGWLPGLSTLTLIGGLPAMALAICVLTMEAAATHRK